MSDLSQHAARLRTLPPSCGPVRLIAVDGHAGSGKSTFAARLAAALDGAPVLHLDDLASHEEMFDWTARLRSQVIEPLSHGEPARYEPYDWTARRFGPPRILEPAPVVLIEGSAPDGVRCAPSSHTCCGWICPPPSPGNGAGGGTVRP